MDNSVYKQQETIMKNNALKGCNASANGGNDNHKQNTVTNNSVWVVATVVYYKNIAKKWIFIVTVFMHNYNYN